MKRLTALAGASLLGLLAATPILAEEITASIWFPDTHPLTRDGYVPLAKELEERSDGSLTMKLYTGTALLPPVAHLSGLTDGLVQMTYHAGTYTPSDLPEDNVIATLAIGLKDPITALFAVNDFYTSDPEMKAMFDRHGIVFLGAMSSPLYEMMCTREITTLEQIKGAKLRMPSTIHTAFANSVGAASVNVPSADMFSGLEKGQLDCAINALNDLKSRSLWDVAKFATRLPVGPYYAGWQYAIDADTWNGLSDEHRALLMDAVAGNTVDVSLAFQAAVDDALSEAEAHGVTVLDPAPELSKALDTFVAENMDRLIEETGTQLGVAEPKALADRFLATYAKWDERLADIPRDDAEALRKVMREELYSGIDLASYGR
ncbi:C4-dicarboxylate TRAP transporter substrate-binding protein [Cereibacter sphaeroides]|uniref:C4-dicarboxylate TRAP transporter substrate-binding protein n=1 Tax=Cereibacter sphaeroides TaxID=1063 RepID=UPI000066552D|nr:TRAP dicarboxylate transporter- DctP subunit [Cereibacter sphaeroides ATCC 17029]